MIEARFLVAIETAGRQLTGWYYLWIICVDQGGRYHIGIIEIYNIGIKDGRYRKIEIKLLSTETTLIILIMRKLP